MKRKAISPIIATVFTIAVVISAFATSSTTHQAQATSTVTSTVTVTFFEPNSTLTIIKTSTQTQTIYTGYRSVFLTFTVILNQNGVIPLSYYYNNIQLSHGKIQIYQDGVYSEMVFINNQQFGSIETSRTYPVGSHIKATVTSDGVSSTYDFIVNYSSETDLQGAAISTYILLFPR